MAEDSIDLSGAVEMLKEMLSGEEGQQQIQNILGMFQGESEKEHVPGLATGGIDPESLDLMMKLQRAMRAMNGQKESEQTKLLLALRPFLKPSRREKVDHAMKLLKVSSILAMMREVQGE